MITLVLHFFFGIIQRFFLGIGGITRWFIFRAYNALYFQKFPEDLNYYQDNENKQIDKNGFSVRNKNFFAGLIVFLLILLLLEKLETK